MANPENIKPYEFTSDQDREKAAAAGRKGGKARQEQRRKQKALRETLTLLLGLVLEDGEELSLDEMKSLANLKGANVDVQTAIMFAQVKKAMKGDTRAAEYIRDTIGQKPKDRTEISGGLNDEKGKLDELIRQMKNE